MGFLQRDFIGNRITSETLNETQDPDGGGAYPGTGGGTGVGSAPTGEPEYAEDGGGTAGSGDSPGGEVEEIIINPEFLAEYPCQAAMVQEVYGNCAPLSQLFQAIFESNSTVNVTFVAEQLQGILNGGQTDVQAPHNYIIKLNTLRLNQSTELDIINTATHEYVHALMLHHYYSGAFQLTGAGNPPTYAELAEGFAQHRAEFYSQTNQHGYMASLVNDIAEVTYEWAVTNGGYNPANFSSYDTNPADGFNGLQEFLQKLAWGGLENTTTFQTLYPDNT